MKSPRSSVHFHLLKSIVGGKIFSFRLDQRYSNRLRVHIDFHTQRIINTPLRLFSRLSINYPNCSGSFLTLDKLFSPSYQMNSWINQLRTCFCFVHSHTYLTYTSSKILTPTQCQ